MRDEPTGRVTASARGPARPWRGAAPSPADHVAGRKLDHEGVGAREAMVLPPSGRARIPRQPARAHSGEPRISPPHPAVRAGRLHHESVGLVEPDRDARLEAPYEPRSRARLRLRERTPAAVVAAPGRARAPPAREVAVQVDAAGVLADAQPCAVRVDGASRSRARPRAAPASVGAPGSPFGRPARRRGSGRWRGPESRRRRRPASSQRSRDPGPTRPRRSSGRSRRPPTRAARRAPLDSKRAAPGRPFRTTLACCGKDYAPAPTASGCGSEMLRGISTSRAMTRRWIWDVPSYSCMIFASRISFSTGYSLMKP